MEAHTCHIPADQILNNTTITGDTHTFNNHQSGSLWAAVMNKTEDKSTWCRNMGSAEWWWAPGVPYSAWTFGLPMNDSNPSICSISERTHELETTVDVNDEDYVYYSGPIICPTIPSCWSSYLEKTEYSAESQFYELVTNVALTEECWNICRGRNTGSESCVGWSFWPGEECYIFQDMDKVTETEGEVGNFTSG